jgi:hypothetical protein
VDHVIFVKIYDRMEDFFENCGDNRLTESVIKILFH